MFFISETGTAKALAQRLLDFLTSNGLPFDFVDPTTYEPEDLHKETLVLIVASTWEDGKPPSSGEFLYNWLEESADDFRVGALLLNECKFAVFGVGSKTYGETFNAVAKGLSKRMRSLGGTEVLPVWEGDVDEGELDEAFDAWGERVVRVLKGSLEGNGVDEGKVNGIGSEYDEMDMSDDDDDDDDDEVEENGSESLVVDLEDIAGKGPSRKDAGVIKSNGRVNGEKEMVTPVIRASLTKQVLISSAIFLVTFMVFL